MKSQALRNFRRKLKSQCALGLWVTLESPSITEMGVALGVDWIVVDAEHGHLDWKDIVEHVRATVRSNTVVLVRVAELSASLIKRALDIGADGVVVPTIETADQLRDAIAFANYPPKGLRGIGAERATVWGQCFAEHAEEAGPNVLVIPLLETVAARRNLDELIAVEGADVFLLGPADYSASAGFAGQWENPQVAKELAEIKDRLSAAGKACGIMSTSLDDLHRRRSEGFRMVGLGSDAGLLLRSLHGALDRVGRDCWPTTAMLPHNAKPLERPPERVRPDRGETIVGRVDEDAIEISPGVWFQGQCGKFNQARNLTTGLVRFEPGVRLPYHLHTFSESITLLEGSASVAVEGRQYHLQPLDNITLPSRLAHEVCNLSTTEPAMFHIAMNSDTPTRVLTDVWSDITAMPDDSIGVAGAEYVTRFATAARFQAGPNTEFIDYFNTQLMPGIQMSGGYGLFEPEGRLPAHFHDFDESICIIDGQAACIVEGREYTMGGYDTALQPRGRVHYFANRTNQQMAMIWVYAGPRPDRIVVDERCATVEGEPWQREPVLAG